MLFMSPSQQHQTTEDKKHVHNSIYRTNDNSIIPKTETDVLENYRANICEQKCVC